jgi:O-antigen/teichoic acid export membrane protein
VIDKLRRRLSLENMRLNGSPVEPGSFNRRTVVSNIAALFSGSAAAQGMTAVTLLLTARQLGAPLYGQYAATFALTSFLAIVFSLGLDIWLLREGARRPDQLGEYVGSVLGIKVAIGAVWLLGLAAAAPWINAWAQSTSFPPELIRIGAITVWLDNVFSSVLTTYKATLRNQFTSIFDAGSDFLWLLATLALIAAGTVTPLPFLQARAAVLTLSLLAALLFVLRTLRLRATWATMRRLLRECFPYMSSELLAWTSMRLDVLIIALLLGDLAVGLYSPAVGLANALFLAPAAVYVVILPVLSRLFTENPRQAWITARRATILLAVLGLILFIALLIAAEPLTRLLGPSFTGSGQVLRILSVIVLIHSLSFAMAAILVAVRLQARRTLVQAVAVAANGFLNLIIVQRFGIQGAAVVYVFTEVVLLAGYTLLVLRFQRLNPATEIA